MAGTSQRARLKQLPQPIGQRGHVDPTDAHLEAAGAFLRGKVVPTGARPWLDRALAEFSEVEHGYIESARRHGERARVWETATWIIANAIAREERRAAER
jgi:hypothetical protein